MIIIIHASSMCSIVGIWGHAHKGYWSQSLALITVKLQIMDPLRANLDNRSTMFVQYVANDRGDTAVMLALQSPWWPDHT